MTTARQTAPYRVITKRDSSYFDFYARSEAKRFARTVRGGATVYSLTRSGYYKPTFA